MKKNNRMSLHIGYDGQFNASLQIKSDTDDDDYDDDEADERWLMNM